LAKAFVKIFSKKPVEVKQNKTTFQADAQERSSLFSRLIKDRPIYL
jgi:hypothetical protein